jgi:hypothetical protein
METSIGRDRQERLNLIDVHKFSRRLTMIEIIYHADTNNQFD